MSQRLFSVWLLFDESGEYPSNPTMVLITNSSVTSCLLSLMSCIRRQFLLEYYPCLPICRSISPFLFSKMSKMSIFFLSSSYSSTFSKCNQLNLSNLLLFFTFNLAFAVISGVCCFIYFYYSCLLFL